MFGVPRSRGPGPPSGGKDQSDPRKRGTPNGSRPAPLRVEQTRGLPPSPLRDPDVRISRIRFFTWQVRSGMPPQTAAYLPAVPLIALVFAPKIQTVTCHVPNTYGAGDPKPRFSGRQPRIPEHQNTTQAETVFWVFVQITPSPASNWGLPWRARQDWPAGPLPFFVFQIIDHNSSIINQSPLYLGAVLHESCRNSVRAEGCHVAQLFAPKGIKNVSHAGRFTFSTVAQT